MVIVAFLASLCVTGVVLSALPSAEGAEPRFRNDYHYVPFAGDVFGA